MDNKQNMEMVNVELLEAEVKLIEAKAKAWDAFKSLLDDYGLTIDDVISRELGMTQTSDVVTVEETCDEQKINKKTNKITRRKRAKIKRYPHNVEYLAKHVEEIKKDYAVLTAKELTKKYEVSYSSLMKFMKEYNITKPDCMLKYYAEKMETDNIKEEEKNNNLGRLQIFA